VADAKTEDTFSSPSYAKAGEGQSTSRSNGESAQTSLPNGPQKPVGGAHQKEALRLVTILYSAGRDLYRIPVSNKSCWLSVKTYPLPAVALASDAIYLGPAVTADGTGWRKSYSTAWRAIVPGDHATLPGDDPMVMDYEH